MVTTGFLKTSNILPLPPLKPYELNIDIQAPQSVDLVASSMNLANARETDKTGVLSVNNRRHAVEDQLTAMSQILFDQQFLELDQVITLEGTDFNFEMNNWRNAS